MMTVVRALSRAIRRMAVDWTAECARPPLKSGSFALLNTQTADSPVRPFGAEPAEPALAAGTPPDGPGAAPARAAIAIAGLAFLCTAIPAAATVACPDRTRSQPQACAPKPAQQPSAVPPRKTTQSVNVIIKSRGGGRGFFGWWPSTHSDLMP